MKRFFLSAALLFTLGVQLVQAQVPTTFQYQAVARNASNAVQASKTMKVRLSIRSGAANGTVLYSETRTITTNANGLFNVAIGSAGALSTTGSFAGIDWTNGLRFLQTELDAANNGTFVDLGTVQMQSVPTALAAQTANQLKLPFTSTVSNSGSLLNLTNPLGTAIQATGQGSGTGLNASTDNGFGVLSIANAGGTAIFGQSTMGVAGKFSVPATNTKTTLEAEHKGAGSAIRATSAGGQAIVATSTGNGVGISASTDNNFGVIGTANNTGTAVYGLSQKGIAGKFVTPAGNNNVTLQAQNFAAGAAVQGNSATGIGVQAISNAGTGLAASTQTGTAASFTAPSTGKALVTSGKIQFTGTDLDPGAGKVLVSDLNGNAKWERPVAFRYSGIEPSLNVSDNIQIVAPQNGEQLVHFKTLEYSYGNGTGNSSSAFTAPVSGIYHFDASIMFDYNTVPLPGDRAFVRLVKTNASGSKYVFAEYSISDFSNFDQAVLNTDILVLKGEKVEVKAQVYSAQILGRNIYNYGNAVNNWFSGHLVTRFDN